MEATEKKRKISMKWALIAGIPAALIALFLVFSKNRGFANFVTRWFSRPVKTAVGTVMAVLPFSVMELEYIALGVFVIWYLVRTVVLAAKGKLDLRGLLRRVGIFCLVPLYLLTVYMWVFGIDYRSDTFEERSGIDAGPVAPGDLRAVTEYFVKNAAKAAYDVDRDGEGHFTEDMDGYFKGSKNIYVNLEKEFPFLEARSRTPKKMYLFSKLSSWMGFTGVYFPFTAESNINIDAPRCMMPSTIAHELAHQRGVFNEAEANFVGIAACLSSGDPVFEYSGWLAGSIYLSNALYSVDAQGWREISQNITGPMLVDWTDNSAYWRQFDGKVEEVSSKVYDRFLTSQGQELGIRSYGACVDLLVAYYLEAAA